MRRDGSLESGWKTSGQTRVAGSRRKSSSNSVRFAPCASIPLLVVVLCGDAIAQGAWWSGFAPPPAGKGLNDQAKALVEYEGALIVGGFFTQAGNNAFARYIARFTGTGWQQIQGGDGCER